MSEAVIKQPGLLLGPGPAGRWDSERVSCPRVLRCADGVWRMWYYGRDPSFDREINLPTGRVGLATSSDGLSWTRIDGPLTMGAVFEPSADETRFDSGHLGVSDVTESDGLYHMWYFGGDRTRQKIGPYEVKGFNLRPGLAISRNALDWYRVDGPVRGAFLDVGAPGEFDFIMTGWPQALRGHDGVWRMYYHSLDPASGFHVGVAVSDDGFAWRKRGKILGPGEAGGFDENGAATRTVIRAQGRYWMFYEGVRKDGYRSIGLAVSDDGFAWKKEKGREADGSVFAHAPRGSERWDAFAIGTPCLVEAGGDWRMYYIGSNEVKSEKGHADELSLKHQIGLAVSRGSDFTLFTRINA